MHTVKWLIVIGWLTIIFSLFYDPFSAYLTEPGTTWSFLHFDARLLDESVANLDVCQALVDEKVPGAVIVQGKCTPELPYPIGAKVFWGMVIPGAIMILLVLGHETWRRICPLSFLSQIPRNLGKQRQLKVVNPRTGKTRFELAKVKADSWLGRNHLYMQFGILCAGLCIRILFMNSNRLFLGTWFVLTIIAAITVGYLYAGKTWCQYFCPMAPVQTVYNGPRSLLGSEAHQGPKQTITQSMCRTVTDTGKEKSACVSCNSPCVDIDAERHYWDSLNKPGRKLVQYGYLGLVSGFYLYFAFYSGTLGYYYSGAWNHEENQLAQLFNPGFYLFGQAIPIPKLVAVPLTIGFFVGASYLICSGLEKAYRAYRLRQQKPITEQQARHVIFALSTFVVFNIYYMFGGRPVLKLLLPPVAELSFNLFVAVVSTLWLYRTLGRSSEAYSRESLANSLRRQLSKLPIDFSKYLQNREIDDLKPDEVHVLAQVLPNVSQESKLPVYKGLLRDQLEQGNFASADSLEALTSVRLELGVTEEEHYTVLNELSVETPDLLDPNKMRSRENQLRMDSYRQAMEVQLVGLLEMGVPLQEALNQRRQQIEALNQEYGITVEEEQALLTQITDEQSLIQNRAETLLGQLKDLAVQRQVLTNLVVEPDSPVYVLLRTIAIDHKQAIVTKQLLSILEALGEAPAALQIAAKIKLFVDWLLPDILASRSMAWSQRLGSHVRDILYAEESSSSNGHSAITEHVDDETPTLLLMAGDPISKILSLNHQAQVIAVLQDLLRSIEPIVQATALYALEQLDPQQGHDQAHQLLESTPSDNWLVHETAVNIIGEGTAERMVPTMIAEITTAGRSEQRVFQQPVIRVGRSQLNEIALAHPRVSQQHAVFTLDEQGLSIIDLESPGALYIGKQVVENQRHRLHQGDVIRFSDATEPSITVYWELRPMRSGTPTEALGSLEKLLFIFESNLLRSIKPDALMELARRAEIRTYAQGDWICQEGDVAHELHLLVEGAVDVIVKQGDTDVVVNTIVSGQTIGEMGVLSRKPRSASVLATGDRNQVLVIEAAVFEAVVQGDAEISRSLLLDMIERLQTTNVRVQA